ncbi:hypothetical protein CALVIDRAFT_40261 [Calocera viscosa TUFC12733]|uniref:Uncharacterized protein n=1 Tax=Calocera viscosa (strain TUFC12733) TaxID=1330018 RepID=A0A167P1R8_CALVF|nr:hypothetical protein CALVIDRAFT_40261 [Calocera viscosa TUFC12733]
MPSASHRNSSQPPIIGLQSFPQPVLRPSCLSTAPCHLTTRLGNRNFPRHSRPVPPAASTEPRTEPSVLPSELSARSGLAHRDLDHHSLGLVLPSACRCPQPAPAVSLNLSASARHSNLATQRPRRPHRKTPRMPPACIRPWPIHALAQACFVIVHAVLRARNFRHRWTLAGMSDACSQRTVIYNISFCAPPDGAHSL